MTAKLIAVIGNVIALQIRHGDDDHLVGSSVFQAFELERQVGLGGVGKQVRVIDNALVIEIRIFRFGKRRAAA